MTTSFIECFADLQDPRVERNRLYPLIEILLLTVSAILSGAQGWEAMEEFGEAKLDWLRKFAPFANGIPSHDRIAHVISHLNPRAFQSAFRRWTQAVAETTDGDIIAVDGKTVRGSRDRRKGKDALHMVSAWSHNARLVLGQEVTDEKSLSTVQNH